MPSPGTRSRGTSFYFVKRVKPESTAMYFWLLKTTHSHFLPNGLSHICKNSPHLIQNTFLPLFKLRLAAYLFQNILSKRPHIVKRVKSWATSLIFYLESVMIRLNLLLTNFQLTVISSSRANSPSFFLSQLNLLPANFQMTMKSSSHSPVSETTSEDNSLSKLFRAIIFFFSVYYS